MKYCLGFYFSEGLEQVVLIKKNRPSFLAGKFSGVGGKVEQGERERHAMTREFEEECGIKTHLEDWFFCGSKKAGEDDIYVFYGFGDASQAMTMTDEKVYVVPVSGIKDIAIDGLALDLINHIIEEIEKRKISFTKH